MKNKKIALITAICLILTFLVSNIYAAGTYQMKIAADKSTINPGDTIAVSFSLTNIAVEPGIGAMTGKLEYDKAVFEKVTSASIKSGDGWASVTYNDQNESEGRFAVERSAADTIKTDNVVFEVTFKVLSSATLGNTEIKLTNISSSTGEEDVEIADVVGRLKVEKKVTTNNNTTNNNTTNNNTTNNNTTNNNTTNNNTTNNNTTNNNTTNNNTTNNNTTNNNTTNNNTTNNNTTNNNTTNNNTTNNNTTNNNTTNNNTTNNNTTNNNTTNNNTTNNNTTNNNTTNNNTTNNEATNKNNSINSNNTNNNKVTISDKELPNAGINDYILPAMFVIMAIGVFAYIQYRRMNNI